MSMSPENYVGLETKVIELLFAIEYVLDESNLEAEFRAISVFEQIVAIEAELNIAIRNLKAIRIKNKYISYLNRIIYYKNDVYLIAHVI